MNESTLNQLENDIEKATHPHVFRDEIIPYINSEMHRCLELLQNEDSKEARAEITDYRYELKTLRSKAQHKAMKLVRNK